MRNVKCLILCVFIGLLSFNSTIKGQTIYPYIKKQTLSVKKWEVIDLDFKAKAPGNPFDVEFGAVFNNGNKELSVSGFYNDKDHWVIRFSAAEEGIWSFETFSSIPALAKKTGKISVVTNSPDNHGSIVIDPQNQQKFRYEDGTPYFLLAFECDWLFALDYASNSAIPKTEHFLNLLNQNGLNQIVMTVFSYDVSWKKDEKLKNYPQFEYGATPGAFPFLGNNKNPDYSALNVDFFKKLDRVISAMADHRIVSHLMIYVWNKLVGWPEIYSNADNMYFNYVVKRYQAFPNIIWDISKEALSGGHADEQYVLNRINLVKKNDIYKRLVSVHDFKFCSKYSDQVDFISTQDWSHDIYSKMLNTYKTYPKKPIFNIEHGGYEESPFVVFKGAYTNAEYCLRRNYECIFAGGYSTYYWQGASWNVIIHNPFEQDISFIKPKFEYYSHMQDFFKVHDFSRFKPSFDRNSNGFCLSDEKGDLLLYAPKENLKLALGGIGNEKKEVTFQWFNTLTGDYTQAAKVNKKQEDFLSPWSGIADAILILTIQE